ncbi:hypothetical protein KC357_g239 [Hortaea werneckii]|nr:hypothetical protein KC357_g239 [Hortaea werneckii]
MISGSSLISTVCPASLTKNSISVSNVAPGASNPVRTSGELQKTFERAFECGKGSSFSAGATVIHGAVKRNVSPWSDATDELDCAGVFSEEEAFASGMHIDSQGNGFGRELKTVFGAVRLSGAILSVSTLESSSRAVTSTSLRRNLPATMWLVSIVRVAMMPSGTAA